MAVSRDLLAGDSNLPLDIVSTEAVREEAARILQSRSFRSAPVLSQMLRYLVDRTLEGKTDELKEYSLGVDVFGRGASFDPRADTIVRVQARRLRYKLEEYYKLEGRMDAVLLELPKGHYVVSFRPLSPAPADSPALVPIVSHAHDINRPDAPTPLVLPIGKTFSPRWQLSVGIVAMVAIFAAGLILYRGESVKSAPGPAIKSLAVLPLRNLSGDTSQDYLADGITEALIGRLSAIPNLRVISHTSVMRYKDAHLSVPEIAGMLRVDAIVEGSVIREGTRIRVSAQLIRGTTDEHFWSETYDRELADALGLESAVAQAVATKIQVTLTRKDQQRLTAARPISPEVYESYLKGHFTLDKSNNRAAIEESIEYFEDAIKKDPTFAPAYVELASAYLGLSTIFVGGASPNEARLKATSAARKALALDPGVAGAHALLASVYRARWQWTEAEAEYKRALEWNPNDAATHIGLATWLMCQGRMEEALAWSRRARELDPIGVPGTSIAWILFHARRYDEAIRELRSALAVQPQNADALWFLGFVLIANGQSEEAIPVLNQTLSLMDRSPGSLELLATAYAHTGRRTEALRILDEMKRGRLNRYVPAGAFINPYLGLGDYDEAFVWFEQAYREQSNILQFLKVHPFFDPVRDDPRFKDLIRRVGLD